MKTKLVIINGLPASGKSTLAAYLSKELHLPLFAKDDFKELLADATGFLDHENTKKLGKAGYLILFLIAERCIRNNISLIIEGNFTSGKEIQNFISRLKNLGVDVYEILCYAQGQILVDRFLNRKRHPVHHSQNEAEYSAYVETLRAEKIESLSIGKCIEVDTSDPSKIEYKKIIELIKS
jgi:predicted kinase